MNSSPDTRQDAVHAHQSAKNCADITGRIFACGDSITTSSIIDPVYFAVDTEDPTERQVLGLYAFSGCPDLFERFYAPEHSDTADRFEILLAGTDFGRGPGPIHAICALAEAGIRLIVAASFAESFYRTCVNTGLILPLQYLPTSDHADQKHTDQSNMYGQLSLDSLELQIRPNPQADICSTLLFQPPGVVRDVYLAGGMPGLWNVPPPDGRR